MDKTKLTGAQERALVTMYNASTNSMLALERRELVRWTGSMWVRTEAGAARAAELEAELQGGSNGQAD